MIPLALGNLTVAHRDIEDCLLHPHLLPVVSRYPPHVLLGLGRPAAVPGHRCVKRQRDQI